MNEKLGNPAYKILFFVGVVVRKLTCFIKSWPIADSSGKVHLLTLNCKKACAAVIQYMLY